MTMTQNGNGVLEKSSRSIAEGPTYKETSLGDLRTEEGTKARAHSDRLLTLGQPPEDSNLDKIRDILFGEETSSQNKRFERIEQHLTQECDQLRADFKHQIHTLEERIISQLTDVAKRLETESAARESAVARINQTQSNTETAFERRTRRIDEKAYETTNQLQSEIKQSVKTLQDNLESQMIELLSKLEEESASNKNSSRKEKAQLSALFKDLSKQLED